ncbi:MAG: hypothetical protein AB7T31_15885 [Gemmatimonadales bacterium]
MLVAGTAALATSYRGWLGGGAYAPGARLTGRAFAGLLDLQVLLGLGLYASSPLVRAGLADLGAAMAVKELRFFSVEHVTGMLIAVTLLHVGVARVRRAETDAAKLRQAAVWQTLAVASVLISLPWWRPLARL